MKKPERPGGPRIEARGENKRSAGGPPQPRILDPFSLRVLTYNFFTPPFPTGVWKTQRLDLFREHLAQYDVVCMQEIFQFGTGLARARMLLRAAKEAGLVYHCTGPVPIKCSAQFIDGGLMILSRFPILEQDRIVFKAGVHVDQLASKGALHARLLLAEEPRTELHVFATHLQATYAGAEDLFGEPAYRAVRAAQVAHLRAFIEEKTLHSSAPVLLCGDFNVNGREATAPGGGAAAVGSPAAVDDIESGSVPNDPQLSEYRFAAAPSPGRESKGLLMTVLDPNGLGFDLLRLSADGGYGVHPITFGDVVPCPETGKPLPRETTLTRFADLGRAECLDFIFFWSSGADLQLSAGGGRHAGATSDDEESEYCTVCQAYRKPGEDTVTVADVLHLLATATEADSAELNDAATATGVPLHEGPALAILPDLRATRVLRFPVRAPGLRFKQLSDHYAVESSLYILPSGSSRALLQCAADAVAATHRRLTSAGPHAPRTLEPMPTPDAAGAADESIDRGESEGEEWKASPSSRAVAHTGAAETGSPHSHRHDHTHMCEVYAAMDLVRAALSAWDESRLETARVLRSTSPAMAGRPAPAHHGPWRGGDVKSAYAEEVALDEAGEMDEEEEEEEEGVEGEEGDTVPELPPSVTHASPAARPPLQRQLSEGSASATPSPADAGSEGSGSEGGPQPERVRSRSESADSTSHLIGSTPPRSASGPLAVAAAALSRTSSFLSQRGAGRERSGGETGETGEAGEEPAGGERETGRSAVRASMFGAGASGSAWSEFRRRSSAVLSQAAVQLPLEASALTRHVVRGVQALDNEGEATRRVLQAAVGVSARVARDAAVQRGRCAPACQTRARVAAMLAVGALGRIVAQGRSSGAYTAVGLECPTPSEVPELEAGLANEKIPFPARPFHVAAMRRAVDPREVNQPLLDRLTRVKPLLLLGILLSLVVIMVTTVTQVSSTLA